MRRLNNVLLFPLFLTIALIGYLLPWVLTSASSLSMGAYDLAEWSSLHPIVKQTAPFLWTTLALRIPLAVLAILLAIYLAKTLHLPSIALVCLFVSAIALLPPLEFFTTFRDDPNYRQQLFLALFTLVIGIIAVFGKPKRLNVILVLTVCAFGVLSSAIGLYQAQNLIRGFDLHYSIGYGGVITCIALAVVILLHITKQSS